jgi:CARDB
MVRVKNQGKVGCPASTTRIEFLPGGSVSIPTPAIPAGSSVDLAPVAIPAAAWNPDADFKITVDADGQVNEFSEDNNTGSGKCIG